MENNQATIEDLLDELAEVIERGWTMPLSGGKVFVDGEDAKEILNEIREVFPKELKQAREIIAQKEMILSEAQRDADTLQRMAEEKAKAIVNQDEIVKQAQAKANDLIVQGQAKFKEMRKASNDYVDDVMRRADESVAETLAELRKTRQNIKSTQRNG